MAAVIDDICNKAFSKSFMLFKPEDLNVFDLLKFLFSPKLHERKFVESSDPIEFNFAHRILIIISIIALKLLQLFAAPLALLGFVVEFSLNFLSANGGVFGLLNIFRLKLKIPDSSSADYQTVIGYLDERITLDQSIKPGDANYNAALCMMASKLVYENEARVTKVVKDVWKMEFLGFFNFWNEYIKKRATQAFMFWDKNSVCDTIVVTFRGTSPFSAYDWITDVELSWYEMEGFGKVHAGFMKALGLQKSVGWPKEVNRKDKNQPLAYYTLRKKLTKLLKENENAKFVVTGHSLGGALAALFPFILAFHQEEFLLQRLEGVYTYGQPRVGDSKFGEFMVKTYSQYNIGFHRFVYGFDMVPRLPLDDKASMFKHFGPCIYFDIFYKAKILEEEPFKNYFSMVAAVMMRTRAFMELGRSLLIFWIKGREYKEGVPLRMMRVFGLLVPGVNAHCPQDYVNSTRLGTKGFLVSPP
ncbi:hypothetical protein SDJN03_04785, partial [Cucurbita argyrosperma subsp. sororia]